jgi:hypothetical protein
MALRNLFGEVALEGTQLEAALTQEDLLIDILRQLKIMNLHLAHISDQHITVDDIEEGLQ